MKGIGEKFFITPSASRAKLGFTNKAKKDQVHYEFHRAFPAVKIKDPDIVDACILALCGVLEEPKLEI